MWPKTHLNIVFILLLKPPSSVSERALVKFEMSLSQSSSMPFGWESFKLQLIFDYSLDLVKTHNLIQ